HQRGILAGFSSRDHAAVPVDEVRPEDHAVPVVLEALGGVHAPDLLKSPRHGSPEGAGRRSADGAITLDVPWLGPVTYLYVRHEDGTIGVAPSPAEAGGHPGRVAVVQFAAQQGLEFVRRFSQGDLEIV